MDKLKKEVIIEGWLIKSPPRKKFEKIWRSRWRRRWFALKEGDLPGQFFLEYYTDSSCRKMKGQVDLDQCEQVDAGLRMLDKFQHMFDVKTPSRIYYLAADSEEDMRSWVKCICQVCGLQETTRIPASSDVQYMNIDPGPTVDIPPNPNVSLLSNASIETNTTLLPNTPVLNNNPDLTLSPRFPDVSLHNNYQNMDPNGSFRGSDYCNRATILCEAKFLQQHNNNNHAEAYTNFSTIERERGTIERSQSLKSKERGGIIGHHSRTQSLNETPPAKPPRKVPSKLKLGHMHNAQLDNHKSSPVLCGSSGPYIAISECYSGPAAFRRHESTAAAAAQQYSPKSVGQNTSDNESVFTDDEWQHPVPPQHTLNRHNQQSETLFDDNLSWSYMTRFSKVPADPPPRPPKRGSGIFSDSITDLPGSPIRIEADDAAAFVAGGSYGNLQQRVQQQQQRMQAMASRQTSAFDPNSPSFSPLDIKQVIASSTPNLIANDAQNQIGSSRTLPHLKQQNCYTNTTPAKVEGTIFRYDFFDQTPAPAVDRKLKPKTISESSTSSTNNVSSSSSYKPPPNVNRRLKPLNTKQPGNDSSGQHQFHPFAAPGANSTIGGGGGGSGRFGGKKAPKAPLNITLPDEILLASVHDDTLPKTPKSCEDRLQYLDLDHSHVPSTVKATPPKMLNNSNSGSASVSNLAMAPPRPNGDLPSVAYTTVDFVKTDAFNRIRADSAKQRHRPK